MRYPVIDVKQTGKRIKTVCDKKGIRTKDIQEFMNFSARQSVYDWFQGKSLPSLDNFYALSKYLGTPMERLIVAMELVEYELSAVRRGQNKEIIVTYKNGLLSTSL